MIHTQSQTFQTCLYEVPVLSCKKGEDMNSEPEVGLDLGYLMIAGCSPL